MTTRKRLLLWIIILFNLLQVKAQSPLPYDPTIRYGKLENGLTYIIRKNNKPEGRASFYLAQKVGSMQEEDNQKGLAHFLEHMAFSSTKNFPEKVIDVLERNGVTFGRNINAYTSYDQTVYYLTDIPVENQSMVDTCLLILHDWSGFITLKEKDIDQERKVIKEEWRSRNGAGTRMWEQHMKTIFADSRYEDRFPIGDMDIVENFDYQELRNYYQTWYRPDLQGIIVVGDIEIEDIENKLKNMFADIPAPVSPVERVYFEVPDNKTPIISIATDKEATHTYLEFSIKNDKMPANQRNSREYLIKSYIHNMIAGMIASRLSEIGQQADTPYNYAHASYGGYQMAATKDAFSMQASVKEGKVTEVLEILAMEKERVYKHGFTEREIQRAKTNYLKNYEDQYNNRNTQSNSYYIDNFLHNFFINGPITGVEYEYNLMKELFPELTVKDFNELAQAILKDTNITITISGPQKEGLSYPEPETIKNILIEAKTKELVPYKEELLEETLITSLPTQGKIIKEEKFDKYGFIEWTLSNGMKVVFKKTDFQEDAIIMQASAYGGISLFEDNEILNAHFAETVPHIGGIGNFTPNELQKVLTGKSVHVSSNIHEQTVTMRGFSTKADLETMFELIHLRITAPRKDNELFKAMQERLRNHYINEQASPHKAINDSIQYALYGNNPRILNIKTEDIDKIDYDRMIEMYQICFANPGSFVMNFTGTIDEEVFRSLVEKYLASLPSGNREMSYIDRDMSLRKGKYTNRFYQKTETPMASVFIHYNGILERYPTQAYRIHTMNKILKLIFMRTMRGDEGGVYSVSSQFEIKRVPEGESNFSIRFSTDPERVDEMVSIVHRELKELAENGPLQEEFDKAQESLLTDYEGYQNMNGFWNAILDIYYFYQEDENGDTDYRTQIKSVTKNEIQQMAKQVLAQENLIEVIMMNE